MADPHYVTQFELDGPKLLFGGREVGYYGRITVAPGERLGGHLHLPTTHRLSPKPGGDALFVAEGQECLSVVGIERKEINNLVASWQSGELQSQLGRMLSCYWVTVLLLEGRSWAMPMSQYDRLWNDLQEWQDLGVRLQLSKDLRHSARRVEYLQKRYQKPNGVQDRYYRPPRTRNADMDALTWVPGIGARLAERLLERFGSPLAAMNASEEALAGVLAPALCHKFLAALHRDSRR